MIVIFILLFISSLLCIDTPHPMMRLIFLIILPLTYFLKSKFDLSLDKYSTNKKALRILLCIVILGLALE